MKTIEETVKTIFASESLKDELAKCDTDKKVADFFKKLDCTADIDEIYEYIKENQAASRVLSDEELNNVAGGTSMFVIPVRDDVFGSYTE